MNVLLLKQVPRLSCMIYVGVLGLLASGCPQVSRQEALGQFIIQSASGAPPDSYLIRDQVLYGGDPTTMSVANDVGAVRYSLGEEHRAYLLNGDLRNGISTGIALQLPQLALARGETIRTVAITPFDSTKWSSFRIYDGGVCSALANWRAGYPHGTPTIAPIAPTLVTSFDNALADNPLDCNSRFFRISPATITPILRGQPGRDGRDVASDRIRFFATYRAQSAGLAGFECSPVRLDLTVEFGWAPIPGQYATDTVCPNAGVGPVPGTTDFQGVVYDIQAHVQGFCNVGGAIEDSVRNALRDRLPDLIRDATRDSLLLDPHVFFGSTIDDNAIRSCDCSTQCDDRGSLGPAWPRGSRHRCVSGQCWVQLEADALNFRPEGLELVIAPTIADPEMALFALADPTLESFLCGENRGANGSTTGAPNTQAPTTFSFAPIIDTVGVRPDIDLCCTSSGLTCITDRQCCSGICTSGNCA